MHFKEKIQKPCYRLITCHLKRLIKKEMQEVGLEPTNPKDWYLKPARLTTSLPLRRLRSKKNGNSIFFFFFFFRHVRSGSRPKKEERQGPYPCV